jgi:multidrug resistance efflux pump
VIDFALAEVEMNQSSRLAREVHHWLDWQCRMVSGVRRGAVFLLPKVAGGPLDRAAVWPDGEARSPHLRTIAAKAISTQDGLTQKAIADDRDGAEVCDYVAYPVIHNGKVVGAVALALAIRAESQHRAVLQLLQWGTTWLEAAVARHSEADIATSGLALEAIAQLAADTPLPVAAHHLCNLLAEALDCSLVALGQVKGMQSRVLAISHQVRFDRRARRVAQIEFAMEEAIDQQARVSYPSSAVEDSGISQAHAQLAADNGGDAVCTAPIAMGGEALGALMLMRDRDHPFDEGALAVVDAVAAQLAPVLRLKQQEGRSVWGSALDALAGPMRALIGRGRLRLKLTLASLLGLLLILMLVQTDHRISARSTIEGRMQQAVVAPFTGYLAEARARAGDRVEKGQLLAALDERDLLLEQEKLAGERAKHRKEYQQALAERDRAQVSIVMARIDQVDAQLKLVGEQLERTRLLAPFSGLLVSGDWSRALGAPVERGQLLFEIVPEADFRIMLQVDEHDVSHLKPGQQGKLRLAGMPNDPVDLEVSRIYPVAIAADGANHFRVEARADKAPSGLRPGMQGVAKVTVGRDSLLAVWTASLRSRLRLWAWSLGL